MRSRAASVAQGRVAKAAGDSFEAWVDAQHEGAQYLGVLVHVSHNQPSVRHVGGRVVYDKKSGTDYSGALADGRALAAEAKTTVYRLARSAVKPNQVEQLDAVARAGGAAFLLVEFRNGNSVTGGALRCAVPWLEVAWRRVRTAESIGPLDVRPEHVVRSGECYLKRGAQVPAGVGGRKRVFPRE